MTVRTAQIDPGGDTMTDPTPDPQTPDDLKPDDDLGDGGERALAAERAAKRAAERQARAAERQAREARDRVGELEGAELRRSIALDAGLSESQSAFIAGADREAMERCAAELVAAFKPAESRRRPRERLRAGAAPSSEPLEPGKVADEIMRGW